jgi:hypothetical protein
VTTGRPRGERAAAGGDWLRRVVREALVREPAGWGRPVLVVRADQQRLYVVAQDRPVECYPVSTAVRGIGSHDGSQQTPPGLHRVAQRIGDAAPAGSIFQGRVATGQIAQILPAPGQRGPDDLITSRILWLEGLEEGLNRGANVDSLARYIYIHGTNEEGRIGTPASHGCIRMRNLDIIDLFPRVPLHSLVLICAESP